MESDDRLPVQQHDFEFEFVWHSSPEDPVRPTVAPAIAKCYGAGNLRCDDYW
ncbi:MAG UNVERIFIED_CONTAM: hypothetical protein LVR29_11455 [Microcystis novacekii LVE1205-3]